MDDGRAGDFKEDKFIDKPFTFLPSVEAFGCGGCGRDGNGSFGGDDTEAPTPKPTLIRCITFLVFLRFWANADSSSPNSCSCVSYDSCVPIEDESSPLPLLEGGLKFWINCIIVSLYLFDSFIRGLSSSSL